MLRYLEIKNELIKYIAEMKNGERLPSRTILMKKLDVSRATIDKAIAELVTEGFLSARAGSGTFVTQRLKGVETNVKTWCLIVPDISVDVYAKLALGVERAAQEFQANVILYNSGHDIEKQSDYIERLLLSGVDGFIIVPVITTKIEKIGKLYHSLVNSQVPFVFCNRDIEGVHVPIVKSNDFYGAYLATKHLIRKGYRNIAFVSDQRYRTSIDRCQGYVSALQDANLPVERKRIVMPESEQEKDYDVLFRKLFHAQVPLDAIFCFNDSVGCEAVRYICASGLAVSDDIGIIGYDNSDACRSVEPALTSVSYRAEEIGRVAATILEEGIEHRKDGFNYYLIEPHIVERRSCLGPKNGIVEII